MLKALQMNDPLVLRLGAKVDMSAPKPASNPAPLDVDLSGDQGNETATGMWLRIQAAERKNRAMREAVDRMQVVPGSAWRWQP